MRVGKRNSGPGLGVQGAAESQPGVGGILAFSVSPRAELIKSPGGGEKAERRRGGAWLSPRGPGPLRWAGAPAPAPLPPTELLSKKPEQSPEVVAEGDHASLRAVPGRGPVSPSPVVRIRSPLRPPPHSSAPKPPLPGAHLLGTTEATPSLLASTQHRQLAPATRPAGTPRGTSRFFTAERLPPPAHAPHSHAVRGCRAIAHTP